MNAIHFVAKPVGWSVPIDARAHQRTESSGFSASVQCIDVTGSWRVSTGNARLPQMWVMPSDCGQHSRTSWVVLSLLLHRRLHLSPLKIMPDILPPRSTRYDGIQMDHRLLTTLRLTAVLPSWIPGPTLSSAALFSLLRQNPQNWTLCLPFFYRNVSTSSSLS